MLVPTRLTEAAARFKCMVPTSESSRSRAFSTGSSSRLAAGSSATVTWLCDDASMSMDSPSVWKRPATSAITPTCCQAASKSMLTSTSFPRAATPSTPGRASWGRSEITVPSRSGHGVQRTCSGMPRRRTGARQRGWSTLAPRVASSAASA